MHPIDCDPTRRALAVLCCYCCLCSWALLCRQEVVKADQPVRRPQLVLDGQGHLGAVSKVRFLHRDQMIVTASVDKTIRLWDLKTGVNEDVLRPPRGAGNAGLIYALAVSPDDRYLAWSGIGTEARGHDVFLYDLQRRAVVGAFSEHSNAVFELAFSHDGRVLASTGADRTIRLWDVARRQRKWILRGHQSSVYSLAFSPNDAYLVSGSLDGSARIWSTHTGREVRRLVRPDNAVQAVDWSRDGRLIATGSVQQRIHVWNAQGQLQTTFERMGNQVTSLHFGGDSQTLLASLGGPGQRDGGVVLDLQRTAPPVIFRGHGNSVLDSDLSWGRRLAVTADADGDVAVWRLGDGALVRRFRAAAKQIWKVAWGTRGASIAWGDVSQADSLLDRGPLRYAFDLTHLCFTPLQDNDWSTARFQTTGVQVRLRSPNALMVTHRDGVRQELQLAEAENTVRSYSLIDDNAVAVGTDFGLWMFDTRTGQRRRQLQGHSGAVWSLAPSPDGRFLLSAGEDRTLRVWSAQSGRLLVSFFFADREWIAWTPQGDYAASPGGERLMGWRTENDDSVLGDYYAAIQFRKALHSPRSIRAVFADTATDDRTVVDPSPLHSTGGLAAASMDDRIERILPPVVYITAPLPPSSGPLQVSAAPLTITASARPRGDAPIESLQLLLDGRPYEGRKGLAVIPAQERHSGAASRQWTIELTPGQHQVLVMAETRNSRGQSAALDVACAASPQGPLDLRPDMYVLAVGIAEYAAPWRLNYSAADAEAMTAALQSGGQGLYRRVEVRKLLNEQATAANIRAGLSWLQRSMTQKDVAVIFYSGHGVKDGSSRFYLLPVDGHPDDLLATAVSESLLKDALSAIPGRILVMLDACHAGAAAGDSRKALGDVTDDLLRDLASDDFGVVVMCSSMGREYSMESERYRQSYFTLALVEALQGRADYNSDQWVYLSEMDAYVSERVKQLSAGRQHPVTARPATIRSFPLGRVVVKLPAEVTSLDSRRTAIANSDLIRGPTAE